MIPTRSQTARPSNAEKGGRQPRGDVRRDAALEISSTSLDDISAGYLADGAPLCAGDGSLPAGSLPTSARLSAQLVRFGGVGALTTAMFAVLFLALAPLVATVGVPVSLGATGSSTALITSHPPSTLGTASTSSTALHDHRLRDTERPRALASARIGRVIRPLDVLTVRA